MRAVTFDQFGEPSVLTLSEIPQPIPGPEQLLVHVKACALNRADLIQRRGKYPPPPGESDILGLEIAGQVVAMGENVTGFGTGEKVFGLVGSGAYAEYCLLDQGMAMPMPEHLSYEEAASIPEAFLTAQEAVFTLGQLHAHESILIHAGGSGVGGAAIQLAHQAKAFVYTTVGSQEKADKIKHGGADVIINYKQQDFAEEILQHTKNQGIQVIVDFVGASYLAKHLRILQSGGRLSLVGLMGGTQADIDLGIIQKKRLQIKGLAMRTRPLAEKRLITQHFKEKWLPLFANGKLKPMIDSVYALQDVVAAHESMEANANVGKIVLRVCS
jgi:putative PIG3 family NAD(P)H quinone oxidoreductase